MSDPHLRSWEVKLEHVSGNGALSTDRQVANSYCAAGACIETTLLTDLSEEERTSLAEHALACSACAGRIRTYQIIEEFAGELLSYDLLKYA